MDRSETLKKVVKERGEENRVKFVIEYDPRLPRISEILKQQWKVMVESDQRLLEAFPKPPMVVYKRPPNIKDLLIRAKLPVQKRNMVSRGRKVGFKRCQRNRCKLCSYTGLAPGEVVQQVVINHSGEVIPMKSAMDCQTRNLLYILLCSKCLKQYLGETSKTAETRFVGHLNTIVQQCHVNTRTPVGQHFRAGAHSHSDVKFIPFEKIYSRDPFVRKARERELINKHDLITRGLNLQL